MTDRIIAISQEGESLREFPLEKWLITIGHQGGNDLVLAGESVAAKHAVLEKKDNRWYVRDLDSPNGTYLEGRPLLPGVPEEWLVGKQLQIGEYALDWSEEPPTTPEPEEEFEQQPIATGNAVWLKLEPLSVTCRPGEPIELSLELENRGQEDVDLTLTVAGVAAGWLKTHTGPIHLGRLQHLALALVLEPPRDSRAVAGSHTLQFCAESAAFDDYPSVSGQVTVLPFTEIQLRVEPSPLSHAQEAKLGVANLGNTTQQILLTTADAGDQLEVELSEPSVHLDPGQDRELTIRASATQRPLFFKEAVLPLDISAEASGTRTTKATRVVVPPLITPLLALVVLVPLLILTVFFGHRFICEQYADSDTFGRFCPEAAVVVAQATPTITIAVTSSAISNTESDMPVVADVAPTVTVRDLQPIAVEMATACEGALPTRLLIGMPARVTSDYVNVRADPRVASDNRVCVLRPGRIVEVRDGPECDDEGQLWYYVVSRDAVVCEEGGEPKIAEGWVVEESGEVYFLEPLE